MAGKALHKTENLDLSFVSQMLAAITPEQRAWEPELEEARCSEICRRYSGDVAEM